MRQFGLRKKNYSRWPRNSYCRTKNKKNTRSEAGKGLNTIWRSSGTVERGCKKKQKPKPWGKKLQSAKILLGQKVLKVRLKCSRAVTLKWSRFAVDVLHNGFHMMDLERGGSPAVPWKPSGELAMVGEATFCSDSSVRPAVDVVREERNRCVCGEREGALVAWTETLTD